MGACQAGVKEGPGSHTNMSSSFLKVGAGMEGRQSWRIEYDTDGHGSGGSKEKKVESLMGPTGRYMGSSGCGEEKER